MRNAKLWIVLGLTAATLWLMLLDRTHITPPSTDVSATPVTQIGQPAPEVTFTKLDGGTITLTSLKGRPVLLHFWASWCAPCRAEFSGLLQHIAADPQGMVLLAVSADAEAEDAERFLQPFRASHADLFGTQRVIVAHDPDRRIIADVFGTYQYPESVLIDADLVMRKKIVGPMIETSE